MATRKRKGKAPKKVQMTPNQLAYSKAQKNLQRRIKNAINGGYNFEENIVPATPSRITKKHIQALNELKGRKLYDKAWYVVPETGEAIPGIEGMHLKQKRATAKARQAKQAKRNTDTFWDDPYDDDFTPKDKSNYDNGGEIVMGNLMEELFAKLSAPVDNFYVNRNGKYRRKLEDVERAQKVAQHQLITLLNVRLNEEGENSLGFRLQRSADILNHLIDSLLYNTSTQEQVEQCTREIAEILTDSDLHMGDLMAIGEQDDYAQSWESPL